MLQVIGYAIAVATLLATVGLCVEQLLARRALPRRAAWILAMLVSMLFPLLMMSRAQPDPVPAGVVQPAGAPIAVPAATVEPRTAPVSLLEPVAESTARWKPPRPSDRSIFVLWIAVSSVLLLYLCGSSALLHYRASRWRRETVLGHEVVVSTDTGPAVLGVLRPRIVMPGWCLDEPEAIRALIIQHEQQHIAGRDALLLWAAVLVVVALPWNLPLWWQLRRLRLAIELDCDARVLRAGAEAGRYGEVLLAVTRRAAGRPAMAIAMGLPMSALERRVRNLVRVSPRHARLRTAGSLLVAVAGVAAAGMIEAPVMPGMGPDIGSQADESSPAASQVSTVVTGSGGAAPAVGVAPEVPAGPRAAAETNTRENRLAAPVSAATAIEPTVVATGEHFSTTGASGVTQCWQCVVTVTLSMEMQGAASADYLESDGTLTRLRNARVSFGSGAELRGDILVSGAKPDGTQEITGELIQLVNIPPRFDQDRNVVLDIRTSEGGKEPESSEHIITLGKEAVIYSSSTYPYRIVVVAELVDRAHVNLAFSASEVNTAAGSPEPLTTMLVGTEFGAPMAVTFDRERPVPASLTLEVTPRRKWAEKP